MRIIVFVDFQISKGYSACVNVGHVFQKNTKMSSLMRSTQPVGYSNEANGR
jgi:hypothetical protein